ncbi:hypothetical protein FNF31_00182 [Cafeteria roenbergensis]|nr:hypothetical protein FNF28_02682 [Cafeteria roenbergensis]KAA0169022.1 hypothetical protein FNF31_00182 [Cafeteria roenbergensis]
MHQLAQCLAKSQCISDGHSARECMQNGEVPQCDLSRRALYECRRGQLDARTRIRGQRYTDLLGKAQDAEE